jgi:hypothetical protein
MGGTEILQPELTTMVPRTIRRQLARLRGQERRLRLLWGAARWLTLTLTVLALACLTDWLIDRRQDTPWTLRYTLAAGQVVLAVLTALFWLVPLLLRRLSDSQAALWVEEKVPELGHRLISAVQLNRPGAAIQGMSGALIAAVTHEAEELMTRVHVRRIPDRRRLAWSVGLAAPVLVGVAILWLCWPETVGALLVRQCLYDREIPRSVHLESITREVWPSGEEVVLRFRVTSDALAGEPQGVVRIVPDEGPSETYPLVKDAMVDPWEAIFVARVPAGSSDLSYQAWLQEGRTKQPSRIRLVARPAVVEQHAWVVLPRYWGVRPDGTPYEQEQAHGDITGPPQSTARIEVITQKPVQEATLELLGPPAVATPDPAVESVRRTIQLTLQDGNQKAQGGFDLRPGETAYRVVVRDEYGFDNGEAPRRNIRIVPEEPPRVVLLREQFPGSAGQPAADDAGVEGMPVPLHGPLRIGYSCAAPQGLGRAQLRYRINEGPWRTHKLAEVAGDPELGPFDPHQGVFARSGPRDQVEFHALPSPNPQTVPGRTEGGGRFDFQTRGIPGLKVGDRIEYYVEVFDRNPAADQPGRSETRLKTFVTTEELLAWIDQTLRQEEHIRQLEGKQRGVFGDTTALDTEPVVVARSNPPAAPVVAPEPPPITRPIAPPIIQRSPPEPFVRSWLLLGPLPDPDGRGYERVYPPETEKFDLRKQYDGIGGKLGWKRYQSGTDQIDLRKFFAHKERAVAYAVCWVLCDRPRPTLLSAGSDDGVKIWFNRKQVLARDILRASAPRQDDVRAELAAGWNEVLVKVDNRGGNEWNFYLELRAPETGRPLEGVILQITPPGGIVNQPPDANARFVRQWQIIGPFANADNHGHHTVYPPESENVNLAREYDGLKGKIRWKLYQSPTDKIDLARFLQHRDVGVAYAVCWVKSERRQPTLLSVGSNDGIKVWVNRKRVLARDIGRQSRPRQDSARCNLATSWNELLVKVDNHGNDWDFYLELRDPQSGDPLKGIDFRTTPPDAR